MAALKEPKFFYSFFIVAGSDLGSDPDFEPEPVPQPVFLPCYACTSLPVCCVFGFFYLFESWPVGFGQVVQDVWVVFFHTHQSLVMIDHLVQKIF